jgi:hypothetical protein
MTPSSQDSGSYIVNLHLQRIVAIVAATGLLLAVAGEPAAAQTQPPQAGAQAKPPPAKTKQIKIEYVPPKNPALQAVHEQLKAGRALEQLQTALSPLRLPYPILYRLTECGGPDARYQDEVVTVCYELLELFVKNAPRQDLAVGLSRADAIIGPALDTFLHETGHAVFDMLQIPVLGRHEDAADQFSAFIMLRMDKDEARRMLLGAAYGYKSMSPSFRFTFMRTKTLADEHSLPAQRLFNILCMAYGADNKLFADVVDKGFLPKARAEACDLEYGDVAFAFSKLIEPHVDKRLAKEVHKEWAKAAKERRARFAR